MNRHTGIKSGASTEEMPRKLSKREKELFRDMGLSPKQAAALSHEDLIQRAVDYLDQGDAEMDAKCHKEAAIGQQREGIGCIYCTRKDRSFLFF